MDETYAVKQTQFLGKPVHYVCQNANGPCPLLAIANVLLLRGQLLLEDVVEAPGYVSAHNLMHLVHRRLVDTNPPLSHASELERLTQEKTLKDVAELLPTMLVGLDVNVRFHNITDFEYTVACAVFDMLDIVLVHGWLLDEQDHRTMHVVGNKSYNELIERLVDYRAVLLSETNNKTDNSVDVEKVTGVPEARQDEDDEEDKRPDAPSRGPSLSTQTTAMQNLSIEVDGAHALDFTVKSPHSTTSTISPKKSPSQQTVKTMMTERHISDADALDTATTLLEEGPILEDFFNLTASQLSYYGLVKLHEGLRERKLCVFFRNNHFSTLFKFKGALYLLVTDAGYLDEPTVVWELLNEIDGDTAYLDAQFQPVTSSEHQKNILTQQLQQREQEQSKEQELQKARDRSLVGRDLPSGEQSTSSNSTTRAGEHTPVGSELFGEKDEDYLLALKIQQEEEALARGNKRVSPRPLPVTGMNGGISNTTGQSQSGARKITVGSESNEIESIPVSADGQVIISEEELEAQRQAERFYQEQKRQIDAQTHQYQQEQERLRRPPQNRGGQSRRSAEGSDCNIS